MFILNLRAFAALLPLTVASVLAAERPAQAILNYYIYETGGNVSVSTSGNVILSGSPVLSSPCGASPGGAIVSSDGILCTGPFANYNKYPISGTPNFGNTAFLFPATSTSGLTTVIDSSLGFFGIDLGYNSGAAVVSVATFAGQTLAGLGFTTPGVIGTWTLSGTNDTINLIVGAPPSPASVPAPLPLLGAGTALAWSRRLRRRIGGAQSTQAQGSHAAL